MIGSARTRLVPVAAAGLLSAAVLTGCGGDPALEEAGATGSPAAPAAATEEPADLAAGLLPADAFGAGARVFPLTPEMLAGAGLPSGPVPSGALPGGLPTDVQVLPADCAEVLSGLPHPAGEFPDAAVQVAVSGTQATVQALAEGPAVTGALDVVRLAVDACEQATVEAPGHGRGSVTVSTFDVPGIDGADALGLEVALSATADDGRQMSVTGLAALVQDGDRLLALATGDPQGGTVDRDAFLALVERAHEAQAAALD
jgi:Domain of unknown function (DUF5642)